MISKYWISSQNDGNRPLEVSKWTDRSKNESKRSSGTSGGPFKPSSDQILGAEFVPYRLKWSEVG